MSTVSIITCLLAFEIFAYSASSACPPLEVVDDDGITVQGGHVLTKEFSVSSNSKSTWTLNVKSTQPVRVFFQDYDSWQVFSMNGYRGSYHSYADLTCVDSTTYCSKKIYKTRLPAGRYVLSVVNPSGGDSAQISREMHGDGPCSNSDSGSSDNDVPSSSSGSSSSTGTIVGVIAGVLGLGVCCYCLSKCASDESEGETQKRKQMVEVNVQAQQPPPAIAVSPVQQPPPTIAASPVIAEPVVPQSLQDFLSGIQLKHIQPALEEKGIAVPKDCKLLEDGDIDDLELKPLEKRKLKEAIAKVG